MFGNPWSVRVTDEYHKAEYHHGGQMAECEMTFALMFLTEACALRVSMTTMSGIDGQGEGIKDFFFQRTVIGSGYRCRVRAGMNLLLVEKIPAHGRQDKAAPVHYPSEIPKKVSSAVSTSSTTTKERRSHGNLAGEIPVVRVGRRSTRPRKQRGAERVHSPAAGR